MAEATRSSEGYALDYTPGADIAAGQVVILAGGTVGVAPVHIASGVLGAIEIEGVFNFAKASATTFAIDDRVYWDDTANQAVATNTGTYLGKCVEKAALNGELVVRAKLPGILGGTAGGTSVTTVAATGSTQSDAAALSGGFNLVTGADATKGVLLPTAAQGKRVEVKNGAAAILKIWPATGDAVNALSVNAAFSIAANTSVILTAVDATTWYSTPLLPS